MRKDLGNKEDKIAKAGVHVTKSNFIKILLPIYK